MSDHVAVVVAGHICLDLMPSLPGDRSPVRYEPGALVQVGPMRLSTGGSAANVGVALHRLGVPARLVAKVGSDPFGERIREILGDEDPSLASHVIAASGEHTSYSLLLSPPGQDRMVLHFPGANDTFSEHDVNPRMLSGARIFHFGYPPAMRRMYAEHGEGLRRILDMAKEAGLATVLDMCYPDPSSAAGAVDWRRILWTCLPAVDIFLPSLPEIMLMLEPERSRVALKRGPETLSAEPMQRIADLGEQLLEMGAGIVGIKAGDRGMYVVSRCEGRIRAIGASLALDSGLWTGVSLWSSAFQAHAEGTTGAGDAANAGFMLGLLEGMSPEDTATAACAAGGSSVEAADATSGVRSWHETKARIAGGWARGTEAPGVDWTPGSRPGIWTRAHG
ncbi:MAG: carbohydrate kinase family protein [Chloroflexota bacterium]|nr:MAG: carbohydrate kinase family protein [Chloroflexota bacterium]